MDMLAVLGLACPEDVTVRDVMDSLRMRLSGGEIKAAATLSGTILGTSLGKGCSFSQSGLILRVLADHASSDETMIGAAVCAASPQRSLVGT